MSIPQSTPLHINLNIPTKRSPQVKINLKRASDSTPSNTSTPKSIGQTPLNKIGTPSSLSSALSKLTFGEASAKDDAPTPSQRRTESENINFAVRIDKVLKKTIRTDYEANLIYEHLKDLAFFTTFNERNSQNLFEKDAFINLCKNLKYQRVQPGEVIFKEGDPSNGLLYIVYTGQVRVIVKQADFFFRQNKQLQEEGGSGENSPLIKNVKKTQLVKRFTSKFSTIRDQPQDSPKDNNEDRGLLRVSSNDSNTPDIKRESMIREDEGEYDSEKEFDSGSDGSKDQSPLKLKSSNATSLFKKQASTIKKSFSKIPTMEEISERIDNLAKEKERERHQQMIKDRKKLDQPIIMISPTKDLDDVQEESAEKLQHLKFESRQKRSILFSRGNEDDSRSAVNPIVYRKSTVAGQKQPPRSVSSHSRKTHFNFNAPVGGGNHSLARLDTIKEYENPNTSSAEMLSPSKISSHNSNKSGLNLLTPNANTTSGKRRSKFRAMTHLALTMTKMKKSAFDSAQNSPGVKEDDVGIDKGLAEGIGNVLNLGSMSGRGRRATADPEGIASQYGVTKDVINKGGFFGEKALFNNAYRNATIMTNTVCEFLIINKKDFMQVSKNYDKRNTRLIEFMKRYIPEIGEISNFSVLEDLLYFLKEVEYTRGDILCAENQLMDKFFFVYEGQIELSKDVILDETKAMIGLTQSSLKLYMRVQPKFIENLNICTVESGVIIGDEILYGTQVPANFTIKVLSSTAKVFEIQKESFMKRFPHAVYSELKKVYRQKMERFQKMIKKVLSEKYPDHKLVSDPSVPIIQQQIQLEAPANGAKRPQYVSQIYRPSIKKKTEQLFQNYSHLAHRSREERVLLTEGDEPLNRDIPLNRPPPPQENFFVTEQKSVESSRPKTTAIPHPRQHRKVIYYDPAANKSQSSVAKKSVAQQEDHESPIKEIRNSHKSQAKEHSQSLQSELQQSLQEEDSYEQFMLENHIRGMKKKGTSYSSSKIRMRLKNNLDAGNALSAQKSHSQPFSEINFRAIQSTTQQKNRLSNIDIFVTDEDENPQNDGRSSLEDEQLGQRHLNLSTIRMDSDQNLLTTQRKLTKRSTTRVLTLPSKNLKTKKEIDEVILSERFMDDDRRIKRESRKIVVRKGSAKEKPNEEAQKRGPIQPKEKKTIQDEIGIAHLFLDPKHQHRIEVAKKARGILPTQKIEPPQISKTVTPRLNTLTKKIRVKELINDQLSQNTPINPELRSMLLSQGSLSSGKQQLEQQVSPLSVMELHRSQTSHSRKKINRHTSGELPDSSKLNRTTEAWTARFQSPLSGKLENQTSTEREEQPSNYSHLRMTLDNFSSTKKLTQRQLLSAAASSEGLRIHKTGMQESSEAKDPFMGTVSPFGFDGAIRTEPDFVVEDDINFGQFAKEPKEAASKKIKIPKSKIIIDQDIAKRSDFQSNRAHYMMLKKRHEINKKLKGGRITDHHSTTYDSNTRITNNAQQTYSSDLGRGVSNQMKDKN